jgi:exodeoxyribonuclease VII large subunit
MAEKCPQRRRMSTSCIFYDGANSILAKSAPLLNATSVDPFSDIPQKESKALSVTQLVRKMKRIIDSGVGRLWIEGEVSNLKKQASGHWYFTLKDEGSQIQCAVFNAARKEESQVLEDGSKVKVFADATIYEARGQLQLVVEKVETSGLGDLQAKFEALKRKLLAEGLFDQSRKVALPVFPRTIGIVTSPTGAAIQDILHILRRRAPWVQPVLFPVKVQGKGVEHEIANAIQKLNQPKAYGYPNCDLIIVGRGGGSIEDLWAFNEEVVARAISASTIPIISAVGHEIDFTIADFVADVRAPTPSAAAELAVPDSAELNLLLNQAKKRITRSLIHALREPSQRVDQSKESLCQIVESSILARKQHYRELVLKHENLHPRRIIGRRVEKIIELQRNLNQLAQRRLLDSSLKLENLQGLIRTLGPDSAFKRGFSITMTTDGKIIRSSKDAESGMRLRTKLIDGEISSTIP